MNIQDQRDFNRGFPPLHAWIDGPTYWHRAYCRYMARKTCRISTIWGPKVERNITYPDVEWVRVRDVINRKHEQACGRAKRKPKATIPIIFIKSGTRGA